MYSLKTQYSAHGNAQDGDGQRRTKAILSTKAPETPTYLIPLTARATSTSRDRAAKAVIQPTVPKWSDSLISSVGSQAAGIHKRRAAHAPSCRTHILNEKAAAYSVTVACSSS